MNEGLVSFEAGTRVRSELGAVGTVERVERGKDGQSLVLIRWANGAVGAYNGEEIKRYGIRKV